MPNVQEACKSFWAHLMNSYVMWVKRKLVSVYLEIVSVSAQDRCTVCAERATGSKIVFGATDETPRCRGLSGSSFLVCLEIVLMSVQDRCSVCTERTIGSEIILDAPDGTPG